MRHVFVLSCLSLTLIAQAPIEVRSTIQRVRLQPDEAWITCGASVSLPKAGTQAIQVTGLPKDLNLDSIRISLKGGDGARLGEVSLSEQSKAYLKNPEWKRLQGEIRNIDEALRRNGLSGQTLQQGDTQFQKMLQLQTREACRQMGLGSLKPTSIKDLAASIEARHLELSRQRAQLKRASQVLTGKRDECLASMDKLKAAAESLPGVVNAEIETKSSSSVEVFITYRSTAASWRPTYEARLQPDRSKLELVLMAAVKQSTGMDWQGVMLELADQSRVQGFEMPRIPGMPNLSHKEGEPPKSESPAPAGPECSQTAISLVISGKVDVPQNDEQQFRVTSVDLVPSFRYLSIPRQSGDVFLLALVSPPPEFPIMSGSSLQLLKGSERLGTLDLESPPPGQPLRISFGGIQGIHGSYGLISRGLKEVGEKTKDREWMLKERLLITNALARSAEVEVQDRVVTSSSGSVLVDASSGTTPGWTEPRSGVRSWVITVDAGRTESIDLTTLIRGPLVGKLANLGDLSLENM